MKRRRSYILLEKPNIQKRALNRDRESNKLKHKPYLCENHENNRNICKIYQCAGIPNVYELELSTLSVSKYIVEPIIYMQDVPNSDTAHIKPQAQTISCSYIN